MTDLNTIWANTNADGDFTEDRPAPAGTVGVFRLSGYRAGKSKKGELYFAVDVVDDAQGFNWGIYKQFTKNGQPHEGSIKSAKITLRQLGVEVASPAQLDAALKPLVGRYYSYGQVASDRINQTTGMPFVNTEITGVASPPAQPAAVAVQVPQQQVTQVQTPQGVAAFPSALPAQPVAVDPMMAPAPPVQPSTVGVAPVAGPTLDQVLAANPVAPAAPVDAAQVMQQNIQAAQAAQVPGQVDTVPFS